MKKNNQAFTMIEIMLVVVIIGILVAMVVPNLAGRSEKARNGTAHADIEANLSTALDLYQLDNGQYPTSEQGLQSLLKEPTTEPLPKSWSGPYLKKKQIPKDPWGREYVYVSPGAHNKKEFDLSSTGPDGVESKDDIINWTEP